MKTENKLQGFLFWFYCLVMLWLLLGRVPAPLVEPYPDLLKGNLNLEPLHTIGNYLKVIRNHNMTYYHQAIVNLAGNVILFIPLGWFLPRVFPRLGRLWKVLLVAALAIGCIELIQLLTLRGSFDVDDFILNLPGVSIGYGIHKLTHKRNITE